MKKIKTKSWIRSTIVLCLSIGLGWFIGRGCSNSKGYISIDTLELLEGNLIKQNIQKDGTQKTETYVANITPEQLEQVKNQITEQIKKDIGRKIKNLQTVNHLSTVTKVVERVQVHDTVYIAKGDTLPAQSFNYIDDWTSISGLISNDSAEISYTTKADLRLYTYWEREKLFKPKRLKAQIRTDNPNLTIDKYSSLSLPYKKQWHEKAFFRATGSIALFGLGFYAGTKLK